MPDSVDVAPKRPRYTKVTMNRDWKYDFQLHEGHDQEDLLVQRFQWKKFELKSEQFQWEQHGNIAIEYGCYGHPSGIATTECDFWVHELRRDGETVAYLMFPIERLTELCRKAYKAGSYKEKCGENNAFDVVLLKLSELFE